MKPKLFVAGSCSYDHIITPRGKKAVLGGTGVHASLAASFFTKTALLSGIGEDFDKSDVKMLNKRGIDTSCLYVYANTTRIWRHYYDANLDLVKIENEGSSYPKTFDVPERLSDIPCNFIAAINPVLQLNIINQLKMPRELGIDTKLWIIHNELETLLEAIKRSSVLFVNKEEAIALGGSANLTSLPEKLAKLGPRTIVIKLGSKGAAMFDNGIFLKLPAITKNVVEPTGAGDSFAGAFMGFLASAGRSGHTDLINAFLAGNVMASFNVERFGAERLFSLKMNEIKVRLDLLSSILSKQNKRPEDSTRT
jgi:sugar/nucleoside kinase (ribokinase family)